MAIAVAGRLARVFRRMSSAVGGWLRSAAATLGEAAGRLRAAYHGRPYTTPPRQLGGRSGPVDATPHLEDDVRPVLSWTWESVRAARIIADDGDMRYVADLCEMLMTDERIRSKLNDLADTIVGAPIEFDLAQSGRKRRAAKKAAEAEDDWWEMLPDDEVKKIIIWRVIMGLSLGALDWFEPEPFSIDVDGDTRQPEQRLLRARIRNGRNVPELYTWHPRALEWDWRDRQWYVRIENGVRVKLVQGTGKWVFWAGKSRPWLDGLWQGLALLWILKNLAMKDWSKQGQKYADGVAIMSGPEAYDSELRRQLTQEWRDMGSSGVIWVPEGSKLEIFELQAKTYETYKQQIDLANTAIDIAILGAHLTTEVTTSAGTGAQAQQGTVARRIAGITRGYETVEHYEVGKPWALFNFGADVAPWVTRKVSPPVDIKSTARAQFEAAQAYRILRAESAPVDDVAFMQLYEIPIDKTKIGKGANVTVFAWHITSGTMTYGEARSRIDPTLPASEFDGLRFTDIAVQQSTAAQEAFAGLIKASAQVDNEA